MSTETRALHTGLAGAPARCQAGWRAPGGRWLALLCALAWALAWGLPHSARAAQVERWSASAGAPHFETLDGRAFDSAALGGRVVVANFWAGWCAPCREELPVLGQLATALQAQPVSVLLVNTGDSEKALARLRGALPAGLPALRLPAQAGPHDYRFAALPATVVFDTRMRPRWVVRGAIDAQGEPLRQLVADLLAEARP